MPSFRLRVWAWGRGGATAGRDFQTRTMALRWSCWRRGCSWRPAPVGSPRPARPGCAGPLGTRAALDTRAQVRPGRARCPRRRGHRANDSRRPNEWEDAHVHRGLQPPWVGRQGNGTSRGARSAELLIGHQGDMGAEVGEASECSPVKRDAGATGVCREDLVLSTDTTRAKGTSTLTFLAISDFGSR